MVLHRDKRRQVMRDRVVLHDVELPSVAARHANIASITRLNDIVESLHLCIAESAPEHRIGGQIQRTVSSMGVS